MCIFIIRLNEILFFFVYKIVNYATNHKNVLQKYCDKHSKVFESGSKCQQQNVFTMSFCVQNFK